MIIFKRIIPTLLIITTLLIQNSFSEDNISTQSGLGIFLEKEFIIKNLNQQEENKSDIFMSVNSFYNFLKDDNLGLMTSIGINNNNCNCGIYASTGYLISELGKDSENSYDREDSTFIGIGVSHKLSNDSNNNNNNNIKLKFDYITYNTTFKSKQDPSIKKDVRFHNYIVGVGISF